MLYLAVPDSRYNPAQSLISGHEENYRPFSALWDDNYMLYVGTNNGADPGGVSSGYYFSLSYWTIKNC